MHRCGAASPLYACTTIKTFGGINPSGALTCWSYAYFTFWIIPLDLKKKKGAPIMLSDVSRVGAAFSETVEERMDPLLSVDVACFLFHEEVEGAFSESGEGLSVYMGRHGDSESVSILSSQFGSGEKCSSRVAATRCAAAQADVHIAEDRWGLSDAYTPQDPQSGSMATRDFSVLVTREEAARMPRGEWPRWDQEEEWVYQQG